MSTLQSQTIKSIKDYYGVSHNCAEYLYYRAFRSKRVGDKKLPWDIKLQNAIVKADKCLGLSWETISFSNEEKDFATHGIIISEMPESVFRWVTDAPPTKVQEDSEWTVITHKKQKKIAKSSTINMIRRPGLYI